MWSARTRRRWRWDKPPTRRWPRRAPWDILPAPEKPGDTSRFADCSAFPFGTAGTYRVALGAGAWIDVLKDGKAVTSRRTATARTVRISGSPDQSPV